MRTIEKIIIILIIMAIPIIVVSWKGSPEPKEFVSNQTFVKSSDPFFTYEITKYPSNVEIIAADYEDSLKIGFVTDKWNLNFGIIPVGGRGARHFKVSNFEEDEVKVNLKVYGPVKEMVSFNKDSFILLPGDTTTIDIFINTTEKTPTGNYTGEIDVIIKKMNFGFLRLFL